MFRLKVVRWFLALVLVACGAVFGLPDLGRAQSGGPAGTGKPSPLPWDPLSLAPPANAVASRDLPLVDEGPGPGKVEPVSPLPFESRNPDFRSGEGAAKMPVVVSSGLQTRVKPKAGVRDVDLDKKSVDGLFSVEASKDSKNAKASKAAKVKFELLDDVAAKKLGVSGFLFKAQRSDAGKGSAKGLVKVDVSSLAEDFGGDYMARLQIVRFRACALTTPAKPECLVRTPVDSAIGASGMLEADLDVGDDGDVVSSAAASFSVLGSHRDSSFERGSSPVASDGAAEELAAVDPGVLGRRVEGASVFQSSTAATAWLYGVSSTTGSYGAAPVTGSGFGDVSPNLGGFSYSYPFELPPAPGLKPELSLSYSSQVVDTMTQRNNPQPDEEGLGWSLTSAHIERTYWDCAEQGAGSYDATHNDYSASYAGSLCLHDNVGGDLAGGPAETGDNLSIVLNGKSSRLIRDTSLTAGVLFRLEDDPGWIVERKSGAVNGDYSGHSFVVTTPNGTQYKFGYTAQAVATVPVGNVRGFSCYWVAPTTPCTTASQGSYPTDMSVFRARGWKWMLEQIMDTNQNFVSYAYAKSTHNYLRDLAPGLPLLPYTREILLTQVDYGDNAVVGSPYSQVARVQLGYGHRCVTNAPGCDPFAVTSIAADYPDVPFDLLVGCGPGAVAGGCFLRSPAFYSTFRLLRVLTSTFSGGVQRFVDNYALTYSFPDAPTNLPFHASTAPNPKKLFLNGVQRSAFVAPHTDPNGALFSLPSVDFGQSPAWLANRADTFTANNVPSTFIPRIGKIVDELGGTRTVGYVQPVPCVSQPLALVDWASNTSACSLERTDWWSITYGATDADSRFGMFNKYVVQFTVDSGTSVATPVQTTYTYNGLPAWRKVRNPWANQSKLLWSDWRGYEWTTVKTGTAPTAREVKYKYFRGLNGDPLTVDGLGAVRSSTSYNLDGSNPMPDEWWMAGTLRDSVSGDYLGAGVAWVRSFVAEYTTQTTATFNAGNVSRRLLPKTTYDLIPGRYSIKTYTYDQYGNQTAVSEDDNGDTVAERCRQTTFNVNTALTVWITDRPMESQQFKGACGSATMTGRSHVYYDGQTADVAPTKGLPTKVDAWYQAATGTTSYMTYDAYGRAATTTDPVGVVTTTAYTPASRIPATVTRTVGVHSDSTTLDPRRGVPKTQTDVRGKVTTLAYDDLGRLTSVSLPDDSAASYVYAYFLSNIGPSRVQSNVRAGSGTGMNGEYSTTDTFLDGLGRTRQTQETRALNATVVTDYTYDAAGAVSSRTKPFALGVQPGTALAASPGVLTGNRFTYDIRGRQTADTFVNGGVDQWTTATAYEGEWVKVTPPFRPGEQQFGQTWSATDPLGRVKEVREYSGSGGPVGGSAPAVTTYTYDEAQDATTGSSIKVTDASGNQSFTYFDWLGRKRMARDPDAGTSTFTYFNDGTLSTRTDARNVTLSYTRDVFGRPLTEKNGATLLSEWIYGTAAADKGLLVSKKSYRNGVAYATNYGQFDNRGRPTAKTYALPTDSAIGLVAQSHTFTYGYDQAGHETSASFPAAGTLAAETVASTWTPFGVSKTVSSAGNTYQSDVIVDSLNRTTDICMSGPCATVGATISKLRYWDSDGTQRLKTAEFGLVGSAATASAENNFDAAGNISMITEVGLERQCFNYDARARLTTAWATSTASTCNDFATPASTTPAPYKQQFGYSAIHNIESRTDDGGAAKVYQYPAQGGAAPMTVGAGPRPHAPLSILPQAAGVTNSGRFTPLASGTRILDTRAASRAGKCPTLTTQCLTLAPNVAVTVKVAGEGTIPAAGVSGVEAILTTLSPVGAGTITVTGTGTSQSSEFAAGGARNFAVTPVLAAGNVTIVSTVGVDVVLDVSGWYSDAVGVAGSVFRPLQVRALDTRVAFRQGFCPSTAAQCLTMSNAAVLPVKVAGQFGVPMNATAVRVIVTAVNPSAAGELRMSPTGTPTLSRFLDVSSPEWRSSTGVVKVGVGGTIDLSLVGTLTTDVAIDIAGYYVADPVGPVMVPVSGAANPFVVLNQDVALSETVGVRTGGYAGLPTSGVSSVVLAVTSNITKLGSGWATMWAGGQASPPAVGTMYWRAGESPTQIVVVPAGSDGRLNLFSSVAGRYSIKVLGHYSTPVTAGVTFTYDANGNRLTSVDALSGKTSTYTWDDTSRLTSVCTATTGVACSNPEEVNVYDADGQRLVRRSRSGVSPSQSVQPGFIPTTTSQSRDVHVAGAFMYWSNVNAGTIGRANIDGTGVNQSFITGIDAPSGITSDGTYLYWTTGGLNDTFGTGGIARAGLDGVTGRNNTFITGASKPLAVSVDANYVYWANFNGSTIGRATIGGAGANQSFIAAGSYPYGLEVRGAYIYWSNFLLGTGASGNKIGRADVGGTNINLSFIGNAVGPTGLTSDGTFLYWTNYTNSTIGRALLNGTGVDQAYVVPPTTAVADSFNPVGVAVTATHVLWTNLDAPKIGRAAFAGTGDQLTIFLDGQEIVNNPGSASVVSAARYYSGSGLLATRSTVGLPMSAPIPMGH
jgi:YD repeat-containing protein